MTTALEKALLNQTISDVLTKRDTSLLAVKDAATAKRKRKAARNKELTKHGAFRATHLADLKREARQNAIRPRGKSRLARILSANHIKVDE